MGIKIIRLLKKIVSTASMLSIVGVTWADTITPAAPQIAATSYILMDAQTGHVLVEHNANQPLPPASLTKLMTSYIAEREIIKGRMSLTDEVLVSEKAWKTPGSRMFIEVGDRVSVEDLLKGIIIPSGNDASVAMAEHIAGSEDVFAQIMNEYANKLGMKNSHFSNSSGLPPESGKEHYSSAFDMALLAQAIIYDNPEFYDLYSQSSFKYGPVAAQPNRNRLLGTNPHVDGLKTGHTTEAGYCLVASAKKDDMRLISVVMGAKTEDARAQETQKLLTYGFRFFRTVELYEPEVEIHSTRVWAGDSKFISLGLDQPLKLTIAQGTESSVRSTVSIDSVIKAPIKKGDLIGNLIIEVGDNKVITQPLMALADVEQAGFFKRLWEMVLLFFYNLFAK